MSEPPTTKKCTKCGEDKALSEFRKFAKARDGFSYWCKTCACALQRTYQATPEAKAKEQARRATPEAKAKKRAYWATPETKAKRRARQATPEVKAKRRAHNATPEAKAKRRAYDATPEVKTKYRAYRATPEAKAKKTDTSHRTAESLTDSYVSNCLGYKVSEAPAELVELKRQQLEISRITRQLTKIVKEKKHGN